MKFDHETEILNKTGELLKEIEKIGDDVDFGITFDDEDEIISFINFYKKAQRYVNVLIRDEKVGKLLLDKTI